MFGEYISKNLKQGKGIGIPKFGQFTFTSRSVDLAGLTNPHVRDQQERYPVFVIAKDFVSSDPIKAGIATGTTAEMFSIDGQYHSVGTQIRFYDHRGTDAGIIPKIKINFYEMANLTDGEATKDQCRTSIESAIKNLSDQVRRG